MSWLLRWQGIRDTDPEPWVPLDEALELLPIGEESWVNQMMLEVCERQLSERKGL